MKTIENNKLIAEFMGLNLHQGIWRKSTLATERKRLNIICEDAEGNIKANLYSHEEVS